MQIYENAIVTIRQPDVRVKVLEFLTWEKMPPIVVFCRDKGLRGVMETEPRMRLSEKLVIVAEELSVFYYGDILDFLRFRYFNAVVPKYASEHQIDIIRKLKREIVREAEIVKRKRISKVDLFQYHYHLVVPSRKALADFVAGLDGRKDLW